METYGQEQQISKWPSCDQYDKHNLGIQNECYIGYAILHGHVLNIKAGD